MIWIPMVTNFLTPSPWTTTKIQMEMLYLVMTSKRTSFWMSQRARCLLPLFANSKWSMKA
jgi:hypothetical protein